MLLSKVESFSVSFTQDLKKKFLPQDCRCVSAREDCIRCGLYPASARFGASLCTSRKTDGQLPCCSISKFTNNLPCNTVLAGVPKYSLYSLRWRTGLQTFTPMYRYVQLVSTFVKWWIYIWNQAFWVEVEVFLFSSSFSPIRQMNHSYIHIVLPDITQPKLIYNVGKCFGR